MLMGRMWSAIRSREPCCSARRWRCLIRLAGMSTLRDRFRRRPTAKTAPSSRLPALAKDKCSTTATPMLWSSTRMGPTAGRSCPTRAASPKPRPSPRHPASRWSGWTELTTARPIMRLCTRAIWPTSPRTAPPAGRAGRVGRATSTTPSQKLRSAVRPLRCGTTRRLWPDRLRSPFRASPGMRPPTSPPWAWRAGRPLRWHGSIRAPTTSRSSTPRPTA